MSIFGAIGSIIGSGVTAAANLKQQKNQNQFQASENEKDRIFQADQWMKQFESENEEYRKREDMANKEWERRFDKENEYNDPSAVIRRLQQAGVNPAAALGQLTGTGGLAAAGGSSSPQFGAPTAPAGMAPHGVTPMMGNIPDFGGNIAAMMHGLASMKEANVSSGRLDLDTERQNKMIQAEYDNLVQQTKNAQAQELLTKIRADIDGALGKSEKAAAIYRDLTQARLAAEQGKTEKFERQFKSAQTALMKTKDKAIQDAMPMIMDNFSALHDVYMADIEQKHAAATEHYAGARLKSEQAITESDLREGRVRGQDLANGISEIKNALGNIDVQNAVATNPAKLEALLQSYEREKWITEEQVNKAKMAAKDKDWQTVEKVLDAAESVSRTGKNISSEVRNWAYYLKFP